MKLLLELEEQGHRTFNLGLAPLSGLNPADGRPEERLLNLLYHSNQSLVSLKGLRQFKAKFEPDWQSRYAAYRGPAPRLARISLALARAMVK